MIRRLTVTLVVFGLMLGFAGVPHAAASSASTLGTKPPKACATYLKSVRAAAFAVADTMLILADALLKVGDVALAQLDGDEAAARAALAATDTIKAKHADSVKDLNASLAQVTANEKSCVRARGKRTLSKACEEAISISQRYLTTLTESHRATLDIVNQSILSAEASLAGDTVTEDQASAEANRLNVESLKRTQRAARLKKKLDRFATACLA